MSHEAVVRRLEEVARRVRTARLSTSLAVLWMCAAAIAATALWIGRTEGRNVDAWLPIVAVATLLIAAICIWRTWRTGDDLHALARRVESAFPDLDASLLTSLELKPSGPDGRYGFLQQGVLRQAFFHSYRHRWRQIVPTRQLVLAHAANVAGAASLVAALVALAMYSPTPAASGVAAVDFKSVVAPRVYDATIEPGNTEVERGSSLLVLARFRGELPPDAMLVYQADGEEERHVPMTKSLDDPVFGGRITGIAKPLQYRVVYANRASSAYRVTVFDYPQLVRADARLVFPGYTGLEDKIIQDVRRVSAVEGTKLTLTCALNKPVAKAELLEVVSDETPASEPIALASVENAANAYAATITMDRSRRLELRLIDAEGRANRVKAEFVLNVLPNRPADLKLIAPAKDVEASPIEELEVRVSAWDDFGLARVGVSYSIAGMPPVDVVLGEGFPGKQHSAVEHILSFEALRAEPDQLLSYFFWAEDIDSAGKPRRTSSDMFFVEVRHFEEIFRQGEQPTDSQMAEQQRQLQQQGQQGNQATQQAEQLAELQKQIINGTWKLIRRETSTPPSEAFAADVELLVESQNSAREQAEGLGEQVQDEQSRAHLDAVKGHMDRAATLLTAAKDGPAIAELPAALAAEQAAYQGLLKLRAREHEVIRQNRQQSQQQQQQQQQQSARNSENSRAQQQLQQLEMREDENRYETERTAQQQQEPAEQREDRQVLNRLRELSRRQEGLNERIKELQSALEAAANEEEKQEIERQLKRLQDEQQQIVRDAEELQERMERPENQQRMSEERQQLEQARENARQSSEALREGMVSQAAAEGERAENELNQLRDQFQERTSGQFNEQVRQMRDAAQRLDEREQELGERLERLDAEAEQSRQLGESEERPQIAEGLREQREKLGELLDQMRRTVEEAETAQPLLAEKLYDSIRENQRQNPERGLESAERSLEGGLLDDARSEERRAREGISRLRQDVDQAAEGVLGNDAEVLERALEELRTLNNQLSGELERETGERPENPGDAVRRAQGDQNGQRGEQNSERRGEQDAEQRRRGEGQQGETQRGQGEPEQRGEQRDSSQGQRERPAGEQRDGEQRGQQSGQQQGEQQQGEQPGGQQRGDQQDGQPGRGGQQGEQQEGQQQPGGQRGQQGQPGNRGQQGEQEPMDQASEQVPRQGEQNQQSQADQPGQRGEQPGSQQAGRGERQGRGGPRQAGELRPGQRLGDDRPIGGRSGLDDPFDPNAPGDEQPAENEQATDEREAPLSAPITGEDFLDWSDRLRDVEEMIADPELRAEAARIREAAKDVRKEVKRHSAPPNWSVVREKVAEPLVELQQRVAEELLRRSKHEALVPIDRDPVPAEFEEQVRRYYQELGAGHD